MLYYPLEQIHVNQPFGKSSPTYTAQGLKGHSGIDFLAINATEVYASHDGIAYFEGDTSGGFGVVVLSNQQYEIEGQTCYIKTIYWHLVDPFKFPQYKSIAFSHALGVAVKAGDLIGYADNTGVSTGSHLHFGLKPVAQGENIRDWYNPLQNNGYGGAIDPQPYFNGLYPKDAKKVFSILRFGSKGLEVQVLQAKLIAKGYALATDGRFGEKTENALKDFQQKNNLKSDGIYGKLTSEKL